MIFKKAMEPIKATVEFVVFKMHQWPCLHDQKTVFVYHKITDIVFICIHCFLVLPVGDKALYFYCDVAKRGQEYLLFCHTISLATHG